MTHQPISLHDVSLSFPHKTCFEDFSGIILPNSRIGIIGRNGSGKSSLLKIIQSELQRVSGMTFAYVPQLLSGDMSGGERFLEAFYAALHQNPEILLLDEPTTIISTDTRIFWHINRRFS